MPQLALALALELELELKLALELELELEQELELKVELGQQLEVEPELELVTVVHEQWVLAGQAEATHSAGGAQKSAVLATRGAGCAPVAAAATEPPALGLGQERLGQQPLQQQQALPSVLAFAWACGFVTTVAALVIARTAGRRGVDGRRHLCLSRGSSPRRMPAQSGWTVAEPGGQQEGLTLRQSRVPPAQPEAEPGQGGENLRLRRWEPTKMAGRSGAGHGPQVLSFRQLERLHHPGCERVAHGHQC